MGFFDSLFKVPIITTPTPQMPNPLSEVLQKAVKEAEAEEVRVLNNLSGGLFGDKGERQARDYKAQLSQDFQRFLTNSATKLISCLSEANVCRSRMYYTKLSLDTIKPSYFQQDDGKNSYRFSQIFDLKYTQLTDLWRVIDCSYPKATQAMGNLFQWFEKTYDSELYFTKQFESDLQLLTQVNDTRQEIKQVLKQKS